MTTLILVLSAILTAALVVAVLFDTSIEQALPNAIFAIVLFLYAFGLINRLDMGFRVLCGVLILAWPVLLVGNRKQLRRAISGPHAGLVYFLIFAVVAFGLTRQQLLGHYDEFSYWGRVVRAMYLHDSLSVYNPVSLWFRSYPPGSAIFEYFVAKLGGAWHEGNLFWGFQLMWGSLFTPFMRDLRWRPVWKPLVSLAIALLTPYLVLRAATATLVDPMIGLLFGYLLALTFSREPDERQTIISLAAGIAVLVLLKDSGLVFAVIVLVVYLVRVLMIRKPVRIADWLRALATPMLLAVVAALTRVSWKAVLARTHVKLAFSGKASLGGLIGVFQGHGTLNQTQALHNYSEALISRPLHTVLGFPMTEAIWFAFAVIMLTWMAVVFSLTGQERRSDIASVAVVLLGAALYAAGLLALYLFSFREFEATNLSAYERYLLTYWLGVAMFLTCQTLWFIGRDWPRSADSERAPLSRAPSVFVAFWCAMILVMTPWTNVLDYVRSPAEAGGQARLSYQGLAHDLGALELGSHDRVLVITDGADWGYSAWVLGYVLIDSKVDSRAMPGPNGQASGASPISLKQLQKLAARYDYVVIPGRRTAFVHMFPQLFAQPATAASHAIFEVEVDSGGTHLLPVTLTSSETGSRTAQPRG